MDYYYYSIINSKYDEYERKYNLKYKLGELATSK